MSPENPASGSDVSIVDNAAARRWEVHVDGVLAGLLEYVDSGDRVLFPHAEVYPRFEGRGLASALARAALDAALADGKRIVPQCPFVQGFVDRHPDYQAAVSE